MEEDGVQIHEKLLAEEKQRRRERRGGKER